MAQRPQVLAEQRTLAVWIVSLLMLFHQTSDSLHLLLQWIGLRRTVIVFGRRCGLLGLVRGRVMGQGIFLLRCLGDASGCDTDQTESEQT